MKIPPTDSGCGLGRIALEFRGFGQVTFLKDPLTMAGIY